MYVNDTANVSAGDVISSNGLTLGLLGPGGSGATAPKPTTNSFSAEAVSGAQGSTTANINGSLALNIIDVNTSAVLLGADGPRGPPTVNVNGGTVNMDAESTTSSATSAKAANGDFDPNAPGVVSADPNDSSKLDVIAVPKALTRKDGSPIQTGDQVAYYAGGGSPIGGLTDSTTYFVTVVKPGYYQLSTTSGGTPITLDPTKATGTSHSLEITGSNAGDSKVGIGASVAVNLVDDTTQTGAIGDTSAADGASVSGAADITLVSATTDSLTTEAEGGADGGIALQPSVAVSIPNVTTTASFGMGPAIAATGAITATAKQDADLDSSAKGDFSGSKVGIGISLSLTVPTDSVDASSQRSLSSGSTSGDDQISFEADGTSHVNGEAESSGKGETSATDGASKDSSNGGQSVNQKADDQLNAAKSSQMAAGDKTSSTTSTPTATDGDNGSSSLSLAGAITINIVNTSSTATFTTAQLAPVTITAGGAVTLKTSANTDVLATSDGTTRSKTSVGIGAAISINVANITNRANSGGATVSANGIDIEASLPASPEDAPSDPVYDLNTAPLVPEWDLVESGAMLPTTPDVGDYFELTAQSGLNGPGVYKYVDNGVTGKSWVLQAAPKLIPDGQSLPDPATTTDTLDQIAAHQIYATSTSGASNGSDLVVAGSLAMNVVTNDTEAVLGAGTASNVADNAGTGDLTLSAWNNEVDLANAKATAGGESEKPAGGSGDSSRRHRRRQRRLEGRLGRRGRLGRPQHPHERDRPRRGGGRGRRGARRQRERDRDLEPVRQDQRRGRHGRQRDLHFARGRPGRARR